MTASISHAQILAARDAVNRAIAERDVAGIAAWLQPDYHIVTARSAHRHGRDASAQSWAEVFANDPIATYVRTPEQIHVSEEWGMAQEHGRWTGTHSARRGPVRLSGVYAAKWCLSGEEWRLEAEIYTALSEDACIP